MSTSDPVHFLHGEGLFGSPLPEARTHHAAGRIVLKRVWKDELCVGSPLRLRILPLCR